MFRMNRVIRYSLRPISSSYMTVPTGPNKGLKIKTKIENNNPRNLEMLNIAQRDKGWAVGPTFKERFMKAHNIDKNDDKGVKKQLINLPDHHGYHYIEASM
jgi:hypothetical protein